MTYDALVADVHFLIELGANFVRGAHYAQDQRFLDLCDVYGLLVWEDSWCFGGMGAKGPSNVIKLGHVYNLLGFGGSSNLYEIWTAWDCYLS